MGKRNSLSSEATQLLERLLHAYGAYYDIERAYDFAGQKYSAYAQLHSYSEQYVLSRRAKIWEISTHEYLFFLLVNYFDAQKLQEESTRLKDQVQNIVDLKANHMQSGIGLVIIAENTNADVLKRIKRTHWRKNFNFGLRGWADLRLALCALDRKHIVCNAQGKQLALTLKANLELRSEQKLRSAQKVSCEESTCKSA